MQAIPEKIKELLRSAEHIRTLADKYKNVGDALYLGRGNNFPVALEGALKLKEISYIHAEGYPAAEMKHGPIALVDETPAGGFCRSKKYLSRKACQQYPGNQGQERKSYCGNQRRR